MGIIKKKSHGTVGLGHDEGADVELVYFLFTH